MNAYRAIALLAAAILITIIAIQAGAIDVVLPTSASDPTEAASVTDEIHSLDAEAQDLSASAESAYRDMTEVARLANPNRQLSAGDQAQIRSELDRVDAEVARIEYRMFGMKRDASRLSDELDRPGLPEPDATDLREAIRRVQDNLASIEFTLERIRTVKGNINIGLL